MTPPSGSWLQTTKNRIIGVATARLRYNNYVPPLAPASLKPNHDARREFSPIAWKSVCVVGVKGEIISVSVQERAAKAYEK
jgi:hypothetical protein